MILVSVIVCTRNRADLLAGALASLAEQDVDGSTYEVWVIDNGSDDHTAEVAQAYRRSYRNVHYTTEPRVGLSFARNRGVEVARGDYLAYIDDDCRAPRSWMRAASTMIGARAPGVFGGPYSPDEESKAPAWFRSGYLSKSWGDQPRLLEHDECLSGCNMFLKASLVSKVGGFDTDLGMRGDKIAYAEDVEIQRRIRAADPAANFWYDPALWVHVVVRGDKLTIRWRLRSAFAKGLYADRALMRDRREQVSRLLLTARALKIIARGTADGSIGVLFRDRNRYPYAANYWWEQTAQYARGLGVVRAQWNHPGES